MIMGGSDSVQFSSSLTEQYFLALISLIRDHYDYIQGPCEAISKA